MFVNPADQPRASECAAQARHPFCSSKQDVDCAGWPLAAYILIGRDDIAATVAASAMPMPDPSPLPLASPLSSLALATPLHHGDGASPRRPSLGRTPIRQPQLNTLPGTAGIQYVSSWV